MNGLPGIEVLFREQRRLANKLTKEEMKAMRNYINDRLMKEHGEIILELDNVKSSYQNRIYELEDNVKELKSELEFKSGLLDQYKTSDTSLAMVHKQREERLERRHSVLLLDFDKGINETKELKEEKDSLLKTIEEKDCIINDKSTEIEELKTKIEIQKENLTQDTESLNNRVSKDILRLKLELDNKNKDIQKLQKDNTDLNEDLDKLKKVCEETQQKVDSLQESMKEQSVEYADKCEQIATLQYQLDLEKRKMSDLQKELLSRDQVVTQSVVKRETSDSSGNGNEASKIRAESMRTQVQLLESRVKLLEERIAMYRNQIRDFTQEILERSEDSAKASQLNDRLNVHGTTLVEKLARDLSESMNNRKEKLESLLDEILSMAPATVKKEACELRANALTLKKTADNYKVNDVLVRTSRLLPRIEACEKTKFTSRFSNGSPPVTNGFIRRNIKSDDHTERSYSAVRKKSFPNCSGPLLNRPRQGHGSALPLWKRKHSLSMDSVQCITPALIDLTLGGSPSNSPSPRDKKSFFSNNSSMSLIDTKSLSSRSGTDSGFRSEY